MSVEVELDRVTEVAQITTHIAQALDLLPTQYLNKPLIAALLTSYATQAQEIEDALWAILQITLDNATGDMLDQIGALVLAKRGPLVDDDYRVILRATIRARLSNGTGPDILAVVALMLGEVLFSGTWGHASVLIEPHSPLPFSASAMMGVLRITASAGIQIQLINPPDEETALFTFSSRQFFTDTSATLGFSDEDQIDGGQLTEALE